MKIFINSNGEIKDVGHTNDLSLNMVEVSDSMFEGWSIAKICCYKVNVENGNVTMFTPYVDSRIIEHIDKLGKANASTQAQLDYVTMMSDIEI